MRWQMPACISPGTSFNGQHAFLRDEGYRYDPELALKCYGLALELFKRKLGEGDLPAAESGGSKETKH